MKTAALFLAALLAWAVQPIDDGARAAFQRWRTPWLERPMHVASDAGRPVLIVAGIAGLAGGGVARAVVGEAVVVLIPVNLAVEGLKRLTDRARPDGTRRRSNAAFPSSHAANAFAVAVVLARRWRRGAVAFFVAAALVAWSRLYLDRHWLSDVVAGIGLGCLLAWGTLRVLADWRRGSHPSTPG